MRKFIAWVGEFGADPNKVAQAAHFLAGLSATLLFDWRGSLAILGPWGLPKEFYLDVKYEHASYLNGLVDWSFYAAGCVVGLLIHHA